MAREIPKGMQFWKQGPEALPPADVVRMYEAGFAGVWRDENAIADLLSAQEIPELEDAAQHYGWADHAKGELVCPFLNVERIFPGCWPGRAQERGDCVSHGQRNANLLALVGDIVSGVADEADGELEGPPENVAEAGKRDGIFSTEVIYWHRRHGGDGWSCGESAKVSQTEAALVVRRNYPDIGVDLSQYSGRNAGLYGSRTPPENIGKVIGQNLVRSVARINSFEGLRDALAQGCGVQTCGSEGFSSQRDENGFSQRQGSWSHSYADVAVDERPEIIKRYGEPLVGSINSWANWNGGGTQILGTSWHILGGMWWCKYSAVKNRDRYAISGVNGFKQKKIDWYGTSPKWG